MFHELVVRLFVLDVIGAVMENLVCKLQYERSVSCDALLPQRALPKTFRVLCCALQKLYLQV
jgi:hypothetical protein